MRAIRFEQFGPPAEVLSMQEIPLPEPGPGQARVRLTHRPINPSDLLTVSGEYGRLPALPATPGFEAVGRVEVLGEGVSGIQLGARVVPMGAGGTWCEAVVADVARLVPVPDGVSDEAAAQFVVNPVTAWVMLADELCIEPGDWLFQTAAGSTLGRMVIQLGRLRGFRTINLVRRREQADELLALGADAVLVGGEDAAGDGVDDGDDVIKRVRELTGGRGVKGALDAVGGEAGALALQALRPGGTLLIYGMLSRDPLPMHNGEMLFRGLTARGFWLSHWFRQAAPSHVAATLGTVMGLMAAGDLAPPVEASYDLADFRAAVAHAERPGRSGKVLLVG